MNDLYVYHHLGLGDHLICNSIVRNICKKFANKNIIIFCKPHYNKTINFMYRDLQNLTILLKNDSDAHNTLKEIPNTNKILIGHHHLVNYINKNTTAEQAFYKQIGLDFYKKWSDFFAKRDIEQEKKIYTYLNPNNEKYIFLQEDLDRNFIINRNLITNKNLKIITPSKDISDNIFDYLTLMEKSDELHLIESCFMFLFDLTQSCNSNFIATHRYTRPLHQWELPTNKLKWHVYI